MLKKTLVPDVLASVVVFLVALPLCLGIAIASGAPPLLGIISGIIGGLVIAPFAGVPLQVSGPAAGLAVMAFQFIEKFGLGGLVWLGIIVGVVQVLAGFIKVGDFFRANAPSLIKGMLGGIGFLILISQILVGLEVEPTGSGLKNIAMVPGAIIQGLTERPHALILLLLTSLIIFAWSYLPKKISSVLPGALIGVVFATVMALIVFTDVKLLLIPEDVLEELNLINSEKLGLFSFDLLIMALGIAFVASAETLLSAVAADKIAKKADSNYNKELMAQGAGNFVSGLLGALPITGVIVRSSANIEAGGKTRVSAILHGLWLLLFVFGLPRLLDYIPIAGLAAILVITGIKLLDLKSVVQLWKEDKYEFSIYLVTICTVVSVDLLAGVITGFVFSMMILAFKLSKLDINTDKSTSDEFKIEMTGTASFVCIPKISKTLSQANGHDCLIDLSNLKFMDKAVKEQIRDWSDIAKSSGKKVQIIEMI